MPRRRRPWAGSCGRSITSCKAGSVIPRGSRIPGRGSSIRRTYRTCEGKPLAERNTKWLQDTWVRFLRLAQWVIEHRGEGIVAFILNHNGLDAPTFRGMRFSLLQTFEEIFVLDLHGNRRRRERSPDGRLDENLFPGIAQGAAIFILVKKPGLARRVWHADLYGTRRHKLAVLRTGSLAAPPRLGDSPEV